MINTSEGTTPPTNACAECSKEFESSLTTIFGFESDTYCAECYEHLSKCSFCSSRVAKDELSTFEGSNYCDKCVGHMACCNYCDAHMHKQRSRIYFWGDGLICGDCSDDAAYDCSNCGEGVSIRDFCDNEHETYVENSLCYPCWEHSGQSTCIGDWIDYAQIKPSLIEHYTQNPFKATGKASKSKAADWRAFIDFFNDFYSFMDYDMDYAAHYLRKGALGYGDWGWHKTSTNIRVKVCDDIEQFLLRLIKHEYETEHKKHGVVRPFAEIFASICVFQITNDDYTGERTIMWRYPYFSRDEEEANKNGWIYYDGDDDRLDFYIDYLNAEKLQEVVLKRRMPDGTPLIKKLNRLINRHSDYVWRKFRAYSERWSEYKTNAGNAKIPVSIGFDPHIHEAVISFNERIGSCQSSEYQEGLGFNHISMSANPHLYMLFYHPKTSEVNNTARAIIGRSVIRFWYKRKSDTIKKDTLYIIPSRLYLDAFTQMKQQFYAEIFKILSKWAPQIAQKFGAERVVLAAYERSRHDSMSVLSYLKKAGDKEILLGESIDRPSLATEWYHPIWEQLPSESESYWTYYPDEYQSSQRATADSPISEYLVRETYNSNITPIQVKE